MPSNKTSLTPHRLFMKNTKQTSIFFFSGLAHGRKGTGSDLVRLFPMQKVLFFKLITTCRAYTIPLLSKNSLTG